MVDAEYDYTPLVEAFFAGNAELCGRTWEQWLASDHAFITLHIKRGKVTAGTFQEPK